MSEPFAFLPTDGLYDRELCLRLAHTAEANPARGFVPAYEFAVVRHADDIAVGRVNLRIGSVDTLRVAGNIGYAIDEAHRGHRYALKACRLLLPLARGHGLERLCITCNPDNTASRRTAELLGARLDGIEPIPPEHDLYRRGERCVCLYVLEL